MAEVGEAARGLVHTVVNHVGQMIASGELPSDAQIMPEELGERFGVSRPVVREAFRVLEAKGMLRPRPRTGTRVLPLGEWNLLDQDVIGWRVLGPRRSDQLRELSELRAAVEVYAARLCAAHATEAQVAALQDACDKMEVTGTTGDLSGFTEADVVFHTLILEASGNAVFGNFASPFRAFLHAREDLQTLPEHVGQVVVDEHRQLADAIRRRDPDAAEALSRHLIEMSQRELEERLPDLPPG